jgi:hypothetical protein
MVRTYWLVQVFYEASWNLGLQPDRTDDQVESNSAPCYVKANGNPGYRFGWRFLQCRRLLATAPRPRLRFVLHLATLAATALCPQLAVT